MQLHSFIEAWDISSLACCKLHTVKQNNCYKIFFLKFIVDFTAFHISQGYDARHRPTKKAWSIISNRSLWCFWSSVKRQRMTSPAAAVQNLSNLRAFFRHFKMSISHNPLAENNRWSQVRCYEVRLTCALVLTNYDNVDVNYMRQK